MIFIGNYPCSFPTAGENKQHVAAYAIIGKSDPTKDGYDVFLRAYCEDHAKNAIVHANESWQTMDNVYVKFAERGKQPVPCTSWNG